MRGVSPGGSQRPAFYRLGPTGARTAGPADRGSRRRGAPGWLGPGLGLWDRVGAAAIADVGAAGGARRGVARVGAAAARAVEGGAAAHVAGGVPLGGVAAHVEDAGGAHALGERAGRGDLVA